MYKLYIDESGKNTLSPIDQSAPHFCVGGVVVHHNSQEFIDRRGDEIKFKYWGHGNKAVFRANDIRRKSGDFNMFRNKSSLLREFHSDMLQYIESSSFRFIWVGANKANWVASNPPIFHSIVNGYQKLITNFERKITGKVFAEAIQIYLGYLMEKDGRGTVAVEASDRGQDESILAAYDYILSAGMPSMSLTNINVRERLTGVSFVTKNNKDAGAQIADMGAHFLALSARVEDGVNQRNLSKFDLEMKDAFTKKLFHVNQGGARLESFRRLA